MDSEDQPAVFNSSSTETKALLAADNAAALVLWNCETWYNLSEVDILTLLKILFSLCILWEW